MPKENMPQMVVVATVASVGEADIIQMVLKEHGIESMQMGQQETSIGLPPGSMGGIHVVVPPSQAAEARKALGKKHSE